MYIFKIELHNDDELIKSKEYRFESEVAAQWLMTEIEAMADDGMPTGRIVTPLPPHKAHSAKGLVTPKPPIQVAREMKYRLSDLPEQYKDDEDVL